MSVLDTHVLVWWLADDSQLSRTAQAAIDKQSHDPKGSVLVSAVTAWKIAMLVQRGRLALAMSLDQWWLAARSVEHVNVAALSADLLIQATRLPGKFHRPTGSSWRSPESTTSRC